MCLIGVCVGPDGKYTSQRGLQRESVYVPASAWNTLERLRGIQVTLRQRRVHLRRGRYGGSLFFACYLALLGSQVREPGKNQKSERLSSVSVCFDMKLDRELAEGPKERPEV